MLTAKQLEEIATDVGIGIARRVFGARGNNSEAHIKEKELAEIARGAVSTAIELIKLRTPKREAGLAENALDVVSALSAASKWLINLPTDDQLDRAAGGQQLTGREIIGVIDNVLLKVGS